MGFNTFQIVIGTLTLLVNFLALLAMLQQMG